MDYSSLVYRMPQSGGKGDPNPAPHVTDIERVFHDSFEHFRSSFITHLHELRLSHKRGDHHEVPTEQRVIPNIDMRETICDYYFDIELPGVQDKSSILIQWTSSRTLLVQGVIARPSLRDTWGPPRRCTVTGQEAQDWAMPATGAKEPSKEGETPTAAKEGETPTVAKEGETPTAAKEGEAPAGEGPASVPPKEEERKAVPPQTILVTSERKIGHFSRVLAFPVDVEVGALKAKLQNGLLQINVPKKCSEFGEMVRVPVE